MYVVWLLAAAGFAVMMLGGAWSQNYQVHPMFYAGIALCAAGLLIGFVKVRCPHCGALLMFGHGSLGKFCPQCGKEIDKQ